MWQIMLRVHLQYHYQYMTKFKYVFYTAIIRQIACIFLNNCNKVILLLQSQVVTRKYAVHGCHYLVY